MENPHDVLMTSSSRKFPHDISYTEHNNNAILSSGHLLVITVLEKYPPIRNSVLRYCYARCTKYCAEIFVKGHPPSYSNHKYNIVLCLGKKGSTELFISKETYPNIEHFFILVTNRDKTLQYFFPPKKFAQFPKC